MCPIYLSGLVFFVCWLVVNYGLKSLLSMLKWQLLQNKLRCFHPSPVTNYIRYFLCMVEANYVNEMLQLASSC
jgi:hypothetical protein